MSNYQTNNPVPSIDPRDLDDNATVLDQLVNSVVPSVPDRLLVPRKTWHGMESEFNADQTQRESEFNNLMLTLGFEYIGDYDDPGELTFTLYNQIMRKDGEYWKPAASLTLPYTTVNNWIVDQPKFVSVGDAVLRQDLANFSDPAKGASLVGYVRSMPLTAATTVGQMLSTKAINIWEKEFVSLITDKPDINDPGTWDWAPAIQAASNLVRTRFNAYGPGVQNVIVFPGGRYPVKSKVTISAFVKLKSEGLVIFQTSVPGSSAFHFTPSAGDYSSNTAVIGKQQWFRGPFINGTDGGFVFRNLLATTGCTGIEIGPTTELGVFIPFSRYSACDFAVEGYAVAMKFNRFHNYIGSFARVHLETNDELVVFGDSSGATVVDSGENIHFSDSVFSQCATAFHWYCDGFDLNLTNCSYDYIGTIFRLIRLYKKITVMGGHIEGIGGARAHDGIGGILLEESVAPADGGTQCYVNIAGAAGLIAPGNMFRGSNKVHLELDFEYRKLGANNTPETVFLVAPTINLRRKAIVMQQRATWPSWAVNQQRNATFALETVGSTAAPQGYTIVAGSASAVVDSAGTSLGGNALNITGAASGNYYVLDSTDKIPCSPGDVVIANLFVKFAAGTVVAQMGVTCSIKFFNSADVQLSATDETSNNMGGSGLIPGAWGAHAYSRQGVAPSEATYYKTRFGVSNNAMNSVHTYITGLYSTILK